MTDIKRLEERLTAVERTVVDGDYELDELADLAAFADELEELSSRLDSLEERVARVEASTQAVDGYVSKVQSVNEDVEKQADSAIAAVDRLEHRIDKLEGELATVDSTPSAQQPDAEPTDAASQESGGFFGNSSSSKDKDDSNGFFSSDDTGNSNEPETTTETMNRDRSVDTSRPSGPISGADQETIERHAANADARDTEADANSEEPSVLEFIKMKLS